MRWILRCFFILWACHVAAQTTDDDRDFITGLIEDSISDEDVTVRLINFQGALSSTATADAITLSDPEGIWLRLDGLTISWDRSALLSGQVEVEKLSADRIELIRLPATAADETPSAAATPFALPDLPVSIDLAEITAQEIILTEALLGEPVTAQFSGALVLSGGAGSADILLHRTDGKIGEFDIDASYDDATRQLALQLAVQEGPNGIAARMLNLPDRPSVRLGINGSAPLENFSADIELATDDVDRITGTFALSRAQGSIDQDFAVDLSGDLRPLLASQYDPFFGANTQLQLQGSNIATGGVRLSNLAVTAEQVALQGSARFDAHGWPEAIDLTGRLGSDDTTRVLLPLTGSPTEVSSMSLEVQYDAAISDTWTGAFDIISLGRDGLEIDALALSGGGEIVPGAGSSNGRFSLDLNYAARGVSLEDPSLQDAVGSDVTGGIQMGRAEGVPLVINSFTLESTGLSATAQAVVNGPDDRFLTRAQVSLEAEDFARFSTLTTLDLTGSGAVTLVGDIQPFDGIFDADLAAQTQDLALGLDQVDPLLTGPAAVSLHIKRDTIGIQIDDVDVTSQGVKASGSGTLTENTATAHLNAQVTDLSLITPDLSGPADLALNLSTDPEGVVTLDSNLTAPRVVGSFQGIATPLSRGYAVRGEGRLSATDLSAYSALVGQRLGGGLTVDLDGTFETETGALIADLSAATQDIQIGPQPLDPIFAGLGRISANLSLSDTGRIRLDALDAAFPNLSAQGAVTTTGADTLANLSIRLRDVAQLVSDFSGPVVADIMARQDAAGWQVSGDATGPSNTSARVSGRVRASGDLDLSVSGSAPLGLANVYIEPRQINGLLNFDLAVRGPAALSSVRGPVRIANARLTVPNLQQAIENLNGVIQLGGSTAQVDLRGQSAAGGDLTLTGPIAMTPPFSASLALALNAITLRDPTLYQTTANGTVRITGPLAGGATIDGTVRLGTVDVQVPSTGVSALGSLPAVTHLGIPMDVRETLARAQVGVTANSQQVTQSGPDFPLNLLLQAPSRIFVRGRGLDAELGGQLRLTGSTNAIVPIGRFDLVRGRLSILGQRFELDEGYAQLQGDFTPYLRLVATTEASTGTTVSIILEGPADAIEVRFESSPELPQDEVLAQLLFGRDLSSISPLQAVQLASAVATLAGSEGGGFINNLREGLDLDDLDFVTDDNGNAAVRAGKYISDNVYTDVTIGANGTSEINLNIDIDRNFTARGSVASDGETSVGIFFERDY